MNDKEVSKHLKYFKVENFKRFGLFEMEDIGQFNLIVGDNNIGKTTILESLTFNENKIELLANLTFILMVRKLIEEPDYQNKFKNLDYINEFFINKLGNKKEIIYYYEYYGDHNLNLNCIKITSKEVSQLPPKEIEELNQKHPIFLDDVFKYVAIFNHNNNEQILPSDSLNFLMRNSDKYCPYIPINLGYDKHLTLLYSENIQNSKILKQELISDLKLMIPDITDIELTSSLIKNQINIAIRFENIDKLMPLSFLGEGAVKLFRILVEVIICKNNRIMIDEIDTGIYFDRFKDFWKILLNAAKRSNTQIFATTHNVECMNYFNAALKESPEFKQNSRIYTLQELPSKMIKSYKYNYNDFNYALENGHEIRGI